MKEKSDYQKEISVIIPIFNGEKYIDNCMQSLENQTFTDFEVILVNDGSTDKTEIICLYLKKDNPYVRYYYQHKSGVGAARNLGLKYSTGKYIMFVDCDDYLHPEYIEKLYKLIQQYNVPMACCSYFKGTSADLKKFLGQRFLDKSKVLSQEQFFESLFYRREVTGYSHCKIFDRDIIEDVCFETDVRYGEDFLFIYEILKKCSKIACINNDLYFYYQHSDSVVHSLQYEDMKKLWCITENYMQIEMRKKSRRLEQAVISTLFIRAMDYLIQMEDMEEDRAFRNELLDFIKSVCGEVYKNTQCKWSNRILAVSCKVNARCTIFFCYYCLKLYKRFGFQLRKAV